MGGAYAAAQASALRHSSSPPGARSNDYPPHDYPPHDYPLPHDYRPPTGFENVTMTNAADILALRDHASALHRHLAASAAAARTDYTPERG